MKVAVTGSSGLIGSTLVAGLLADGHEVVRLVRRPPRAAGEVRWDPQAADGGLSSLDGLRGVDACFHLAAAGVADRRWTAAYKAEVRASRILGTRALAGALARLTPRPSVLVSASAIGYYGSGADSADETAPAGNGFLARLVHDWEEAADPARAAGIRVVHPRSGLVLSPEGGILGKLLRPARLGVCPRFGSGRQLMSWIALTDEVAALRFLLARDDIAGPVNLTAPTPVTNAVFTAALHAAVGRRDHPWFRIPAPLLRVGIGEASVELLSSAAIAPARLTAAGYTFQYPALADALEAELSKP